MNDYQAFTRALFAQNQFAIKYDIDACRAALDALGIRRFAKRIVLVGGTNGKGTTCAELNALAMAAGLRVGLYTSPHLVDFRERIRIDGQPISEQTVLALGRPIFKRFGGRHGPPEGARALSYFELTTLLAFRAFAAHDLDLAIIEVGLGGRLDATNIVTPDAAIITSVSLDHQAYLGDTLDAIASEKLGIARDATPLILHTDSGGFDALDRVLATQTNRPSVVRVSDGENAAEWNRELANNAFRGLFPNHWSPQLSDVAHSRVQWPGRRQQVAHAAGTLLLDGAHNPAAAAQCAEWVASLVGAEKIPVAIGVSGGRDPIVLAEILSPIASRFIAVEAQSAPCTPSAQIAAAFNLVGLPCEDGGKVRTAVKQLQSMPSALLTGSLYAVGDALRALGNSPESLSVYDEAGD